MVACLAPLCAQETFPVNDVQDRRADAYAIANATIYVDYQTKLENATLLIRKGKVARVGQDLEIPAGYTVVDMKGKWIYPAMIDLYTSYGMPKIERPRSRGFFGRREQVPPATDGPYNANDAIKSHFNAADAFKVNAKDAKAMRALGFGAALTFRADGIARGSSALASLAEDTPNNVLMLSKAAAHFSLNRGTSTQDYPRSLMGYIALLRQTQFDADWYAKLEENKFTDRSLDAWLALQDLPQIMEANSWLNILRLDRVGDGLGKQYVFKSGGDAYQRIDEIKATGASLIVPIDFPDAYDVSDPFDAERVSLADMKHWEMAPANPAALAKAGVPFALTTHGLKKKKDFWANLRKAIKHGLSETDALKALTHTPAELIGAADIVGSLKPGSAANFIIASGNLFGEKTKLYENWIQGHRYVLADMPGEDRSGVYALTVGDLSYTLEISGEPGKHKASIKTGDEGQDEEAAKADDAEEADAKPSKPAKKSGIAVTAKFSDDMVTLRFNPKKDAGAIRLSGWLSGKDWVGGGELADGSPVSWRAEYQGELPKKDEKKGRRGGPGKKPGNGEKPGKKDDPLADMGALSYPFTSYGWETAPKQETILFQNATIWTNEADGVLENADLLVRDGKIAKVGKGLRAPRGAVKIDASGKHITAGIIDEHSHIALSGTNDIATNSGMVRMGDVVDSEDVDIYRQLAGGVTAAQLLHGSANPIGGQSALVKFRWGSTPDKMLIENADGFIKFALGENVKRSRSSSSIRYPQTRMGVEQVYMDAFSAARDYQRHWQAYNALSDSEKAAAEPPRRDLAMDAMAEILDKKRFITCHSYVQSEINMLMKVAERFNFNVNTFTHILEGYKVADKMAAHGAGGSTFADWWAYKWEVRYAIPYNPMLMAMAGVTVAINSDDAEMARRLNQEAAKSVKYGGMSEQDALKMVTLNPAKLLHLDDRMGSLKPGKDADLALWSDHPLSIYAKAEKTLVDGIVYYDMERDLAMRDAIRAERARLIQKMIKAKKSGGPASRRFSPTRVRWQCDHIVYDGELVGGHGH